MKLEELVHNTLYSIADLNSQIPDVDQMAEHLCLELGLGDIEKFKIKFIAHLSDSEILKTCFYPGVIDELQQLIASLEENSKSILIASWTQGNLFLQSQKAAIFQEHIHNKNIGSPSIYASLEKLDLLSSVVEDFENQGCDLICVIDDRINNVLNAHKKLFNAYKNLKFIHKIRPDKSIIHKLNLNDKAESWTQQGLIDITEWIELEKLLLDSNSKKIGLILDKDGVIYNTTLYRVLLEKSLIEFLQEEINNKY